MPKKQLALAMALKQVEMAYGKGAVMQLGSAEVAKVGAKCSQPTPSPSLEHAWSNPDDVGMIFLYFLLCCLAAPWR